MTQHAKTDPRMQKPFFYTEECGLALMMNARSGKKLGMDKEMWTDVVDAIREDTHPGATKT